MFLKYIPDLLCVEGAMHLFKSMSG